MIKMSDEEMLELAKIFHVALSKTSCTRPMSLASLLALKIRNADDTNDPFLEGNIRSFLKGN